jgi:simple sugar transport system substrate-binding protein
VADYDIAPGGVGAPCRRSGDCHAGTCGPDGLCTAACDSNADCPAPSACLARTCQRPLKVGALWAGVAAGGEGWTLTHEEGMADAAAALPYVSWSKKENVISDDEVGKAIDEFVAEGVDVIVANSSNQLVAASRKADEYPGVKFLVADTIGANERNLGTYHAHGVQAYWVAGKVAGTKTAALGPGERHRLGYVGSYVTPDVVRFLSAFYLGAKSVDPEVTLEVQWTGFWTDLSTAPQFEYVVRPGGEAAGERAGETKRYFYEQLLARRLVDHGAKVIGHGADNQRVVRFIDELAMPGVYSVSNDNPNAYKALAPQPNGESLPTGEPLKSCLGSPYWNWGPLYVELFEEMHRGAWRADNRVVPLTADVATSVIGFNLNPVVGVDDSVVRGFVNDVAARGWQAVFAGPYATTGQRDRDGDGAADVDQAVAAGDTLSDDEYARMCWFPAGIVERVPADSDDPSSEVPARVPDATFGADPRREGQRAEMTRAAFPGLSFDCNVNQ